MGGTSNKLLLLIASCGVAILLRIMAVPSPVRYEQITMHRNSNKKVQSPTSSSTANSTLLNNVSHADMDMLFRYLPFHVNDNVGDAFVVQPDYNKHFLIVSKKHNVAITLIPKVMITSISHIIETEECVGFPKNRCREYRKNPHLLDNTNLDNFTRVVFVRDPAERALSAYLNSDNNPWIRLHHCTNTSSCTFREWVQELKRNQQTTVFQKNVHFQPQTWIAQFDKMRYHHVLRLSSPVDQEFFWKHLLGQANIPKPENISNNLTKEEVLSHFTMDIIHDLVELYLEDFLLWAQVLKHGTPRLDGEITAYDVFDVQSLLIRQ